MTDATIFIAIEPIHNAVAIFGFLVCVMATVSRRICTTNHATAAAVHILLVSWVILLWIDHILSTPPLILAVIFRLLLLSVSIILVFSARLQMPKAVLLNKSQVDYEKRSH